MSTAPAPKHPVLANLWQLILKYGPILVQYLISSGILKLPPGVTLPPLPTPGAQMDASLVEALSAVEIDVDHHVLSEHLKKMHSLASVAGHYDLAA